MKSTATGFFGLLALAVLAACAPTESGSLELPRLEARAEVRDASGRIVAVATAHGDDRLTLRIEAIEMALPIGTYGLHLHAIGRCDPPSFDSAGPHWNPTNRHHGRLNPGGPHLGDLPNLVGGGGSLGFSISGASLRGSEHPLLDADGASLVIHAASDDYRTDPSGNSGRRIACGVFR